MSQPPSKPSWAPTSLQVKKILAPRVANLCPNLASVDLPGLAAAPTAIKALLTNRKYDI